MNKYNKYLAALLVVMSFNVLQTNVFQPKIAVINENYSLDDSLTAQNRPVLTLENQKMSGKRFFNKDEKFDIFTLSPKPER